MANRQDSETSSAAVGEVEKLSIDHILCPIDFSEFSRRALRYAVSLSRHFNAKLHVQYTAELPI